MIKSKLHSIKHKIKEQIDLFTKKCSNDHFHFMDIVKLLRCLFGDNLKVFLKNVCQGNSNEYQEHMSHVMRKPDFCICENKDADQLRGNREADQHLCFCYTVSTIPLLPKYEISSL